MAIFLALRAGARARTAWVAAIGGAFCAILVLKLALGLFPAAGAPIDVRSPSGHTATAAAAYGGLVLLVLGRAPGVAAAIIVALAIGASRVALDLHSLPEAALGGAVGVASVLALGRWSGVSAMRRQDALLLVAIACVLVGIEHGRHASIEPALQRLEHTHLL